MSSSYQKLKFFVLLSIEYPHSKKRNLHPGLGQEFVLKRLALNTDFNIISEKKKMSLQYLSVGSSRI